MNFVKKSGKRSQNYVDKHLPSGCTTTTLTAAFAFGSKPSTAHCA